MCARYMVTMTIPFEKMHELGAVYVKIYKTFPSSIKIIAKSPFITTYEKEIHIYTLLEIDDNLTGAGLKDLTNFFNQYNVIEGHEWKIETLVNYKEALGMVGISLD